MRKLPELPEKERTIFKIEIEPEIPQFQEVEKELIDVRYALLAPYAYAHIYWDDNSKELIYYVEEPELTTDEKRILNLLEEGIKELINISYLQLRKGETIIQYLEKNLKVMLSELRITLTKDSYLKIMYYIYRDFVGLGEIEPFMNDYFVEDIECNGIGYPIYVVHRKYRNLRTNIAFEKTKDLASFVEKLAQKCGQYISYATPLLDGALPDGSRVNATFTEDISSRGPTFTVRRFTRRPWTPTQLMYLKTLSPEILAYLWLLIEYEKNIMVIGGTASGKTSLLNGLSFFIPPQARIVSIEDTRELNIEHTNWLPSVARSGVGLANLVGQKYGEVTLFNLLKESFRMNPDYVIIGEIRGDEAYVLFQGMASIKGDETILLLNHDKPKNIAIKDLKPNIAYKAICLDKDGNMKIMPLKKRLVHPSRNELYEIRTKTGRKVTLTPNHSILTEENNRIKSYYAEEIKKGDKILIPKKIPCNYANDNYMNLLEELPDARVFAPRYIKEAVKKLGYKKAGEICKIKSISDYYANFSDSKPSSLKVESFKELMNAAEINYILENIKIKYDNNSKSLSAKFEISDEFLRLLGYYISEGTLQNKRKVAKIALYAKRKKILEDMSYCIKKVIGEDPDIRTINSGYGTSEELSFSHKVLVSVIEKYCKKKSENKTIPDFIFGLSKERIGQFLSGLYSGDGAFTKNYYGYYTISNSLADKLAKLLLAYDIVATIRERSRRKNKDYEIIFYRHEYKKEFLKYVSPIRESIPLSNPSKRRISAVNDFYIDRIKDIRKITLNNPELVYDISVQGSRNFIGGFGGIMLHNSGHPSFGTMHANDIDTMIKRLETPPINLSPSLVETMDAVIVMVQTRVNGKPVRRIKDVTEIISVTGSKALTNKVFSWNPTTDNFTFGGQSHIFNELVSQEGINEKELTNELRRRTDLLIKMYNKGVFDFSSVQRVINLYYKSPEKVLKEFEVAL